jgi:hypothetical protein
VLTGASGAFGGPLKAALERESVDVSAVKYGRDWDYGDYSRVESLLRDADLLVLAHGSKLDHAMDANCASFIEFIERFRRLRSGSTAKPEIWAVGSEIEFHPTWGNEELLTYARSKRTFARYAARLYRDPNVLYRHIVPSAFHSPMGPGLISGRTAAKIALFFIRRGWRYVPVSYTGVAYLYYFKFICL